MDVEENPNPYILLDRTRRAEVNWCASIAAKYFEHKAKDALEAAEVLAQCNFDARKVSREESIVLLQKTIAVAKATKDKFLRVRRELDNLIFNIDWFITRCSQDLKRFRG